LVEGWDEQLIQTGAAIFEKRKQFLDQIIPLFRHYFRFISRGTETVDIKYLSQLREGSFRELLHQCLAKDRAAMYTTVGIHKDDLDLEIDGFPIKKYGSQGQQKSFLISIKLAQFEYTSNIKGFKPVLLLDDVFDKLDDLRVQQLIRLVSENSFGQVFVTDTSETRIRAIFDAMEIDHKIFLLPASHFEYE